VDEKQHRTWLCSVVFTDIVRYTQQPVERQLDLKGQLEGYIAHAVARVAPDNRIIVDTGDGAALCFLGDPEEALIASLGLRDVLRQAGHDREGGLLVRIGVNLGPVRIVRSLNGQLNPLGDGINKAQRVMSFANANQILVSRSFYDVIACLSEEYARLFHYQGVQKDKHGLDHTLYEVVVPGEPDTETRVLLTRVVDPESSVEVALANGWDPSVLEAVSAELATYIGPLAKVLVKKAAKRAANTDELRRLLADSISLEAGKRAFMSNVERPKETVPEVHTPATKEVKSVQSAASAPMPSHDAAELTEIEHSLAAALGPVARVLVKRLGSKTADLNILCRQLADEISSAEQRRAFLAAVGKYLKRAG